MSDATKIMPAEQGLGARDDYEAPALRIIGPVSEFTFGSGSSANDNAGGLGVGVIAGGTLP